MYKNTWIHTQWCTLQHCGTGEGIVTVFDRGMNGFCSCYNTWTRSLWINMDKSWKMLNEKVAKRYVSFDAIYVNKKYAKIYQVQEWETKGKINIDNF